RRWHMNWRYLFFVAALPLAACTGPAVPQPAHKDAECAAAFIDLIEKDQGYHLGVRPDIEKELAAANLELPDLLKGCIELLRHGSASDDRVKSARFLGRLGNPSAVKPLVESLGDPDERVREATCYALTLLPASAESADEPVLLKLCRDDPSVAVRVAAAV